MTDTRDRPQVILVTPPELELGSFAARLAACLDAAPVACLRLALATRDEDRVARAADALREAAHARDVPVVVEGHPDLAARLGLDGVHLTDGARSVRRLRKALGPDAIVGAFCGTSRHDGLIAGEDGADYVGFGPIGGEGAAEPEIFAWWSEMIELPVVAEGRLDDGLVRALAPAADFFAFGPEVWEAQDPVAALRALHAATG